MPLPTARIDLDPILSRWKSLLEALVLFGSAARGEMWEHSDIDLLGVVRAGLPIRREWYAAWDAEIGPPTPRLSPHFVALPRTAQNVGGLWLEVAMDGVILWDPRWRVAQLLASLREQIAAGAAVRRWAHGHSYWVCAARTADDSLPRARKRLAALDTLYAEQSWADVVREAQEIVELALKAVLRRHRIETPRLHDPSDLLLEAQPALPKTLAAHLKRLCAISRQLRRDRELAFYGSEDLTLSEFYRESDAREARADARWVVATIEREFRT
jgi:hypothetical protein